MSYTENVTTRESLYRLIDELPESLLEPAEYGLQRLIVAHDDPFWAHLENAEVDDEPISPETLAKIDAALDRLGRARPASATSARIR